MIGRIGDSKNHGGDLTIGESIATGNKEKEKNLSLEEISVSIIIIISNNKDSKPKLTVYPAYRIE